MGQNLVEVIVFHLLRMNNNTLCMQLLKDDKEGCWNTVKLNDLFVKICLVTRVLIIYPSASDVTLISSLQ